jgi:gluconokinase
VVVVIMGVSGSGKTTVGRALATALRGRFYDADDFHSVQSIAKMQRGEPLTETDREPWLRDLAARIGGWLREPGAVVLACSALTARSREILGVGRDGVALVWLNGAEALIRRRIEDREHFMPASLLASQVATLEPPEDAIVLDIAAKPEALVEAITAELERHGAAGGEQ